jgi:hypothetical protein
MIDWNEFTTYYVKRLKGAGTEDAYHCLIEADDQIIPNLIDTFRNSKDPAIRSELVEIIWQHRNPATIEFLSEALHDPIPEVWKNAMDGLVALACPKSLDVLRSVRTRAFPKETQTEEFHRWLKEAIDQVEERMKSDQAQEWERIARPNMKRFELISLKVQGIWDPSDLIGLIHDEFFTLENVHYLSEKDILVIPYRRILHNGPRKTIRWTLLSKDEEVNVVRSELRIHHVESYEVYDPDRIGIYAFNYVDFDEEGSILTVETTTNLKIRIKVSDILIESEDLEIKGKSVIKSLGPIEQLDSKVYE